MSRFESTDRFYLACDLTGHPNSRQLSGEVPHITLAPPATVERRRMPDIDSFLRVTTAKMAQMTFRSLGMIQVGPPESPVSATQFERSQEIHELHQYLMERLVGFGCEFVGIEYADRHYNPHSVGMVLEMGGELVVDNITMFVSPSGAHVKQVHRYRLQP